MLKETITLIVKRTLLAIGYAALCSLCNILLYLTFLEAEAVIEYSIKDEICKSIFLYAAMGFLNFSHNPRYEPDILSVNFLWVFFYGYTLLRCNSVVYIISTMPILMMQIVWTYKNSVYGFWYPIRSKLNYLSSVTQDQDIWAYLIGFLIYFVLYASGGMLIIAKFCMLINKNF